MFTAQGTSKRHLHLLQRSASLVLHNRSPLVLSFSLPNLLQLFPKDFLGKIADSSKCSLSCCFRIWRGDAYLPKLIHTSNKIVLKDPHVASWKPKFPFTARQTIIFIMQWKHSRTGFSICLTFLFTHLWAPGDWHQFLTVQTDFFLPLLLEECQQVTTHALLMLFNNLTWLIQISRIPHPFNRYFLILTEAPTH